jgi:serine/threonine protein kinase
MATRVRYIAVQPHAAVNANFHHITTLVPANPDQDSANDGIELVQHQRHDHLCVLKRYPANEMFTANREIRITKQLQGAANVIVYEDYYFDTTTSPPRLALLTRFCRYGSLDKLIYTYRHAHRKFPEASMWHVFISLTKALVHMEHGPNNHRRREPWDSVLHRDIWPANIMLSGSDSSGYPRVLLSDFGSSITKTDIETDRIPLLRQQCDFAPLGGTTIPGRLSEDVCQIGLVMVALCRTTFCPRGYRDRFGTRPAGGYYSAELNQVLAQCLSRNVGDRPDARALLKRIHRSRVFMHENRTVEFQEGYLNSKGRFAQLDVWISGR